MKRVGRQRDNSCQKTEIFYDLFYDSQKVLYIKTYTVYSASKFLNNYCQRIGTYNYAYFSLVSS